MVQESISALPEMCWRGSRFSSSTRAMLLDNTAPDPGLQIHLMLVLPHLHKADWWSELLVNLPLLPCLFPKVTGLSGGAVTIPLRCCGKGPCTLLVVPCPVPHPLVSSQLTLLPYIGVGRVWEPLTSPHLDLGCETASKSVSLLFSFLSYS